MLVLANLGSRDVTYKGESIQPAREGGAELLRDYDSVASDIELPILTPALEYIGSLSYRYPEVTDRDAEAPMVGLFYTDQQDPRHSPGDTVEVARIVRKKLPQDFPNRSENHGIRLMGKKLVPTYRFEGDNPARYDHAYGFYERFFAISLHLREPQKWLCFVLASGGTPAMNAMLLLHSINHFGANCVQVYVSPEGEAVSMRVGEKVARDDSRRRANEALKTLQFKAAATVAENALGGGWRVEACRYADYRLAFDFRRARERVQEALRGVDEGARGALERHAEAIERLEQGAATRRNRALLIAELFYNLEIKQETGEFVDALGRAFRLQEALLTWVVEDNTGLRADKSLIPDQEEALNEVPGLLDHLVGYKTPEEGTQLQLKQKMNRVALMAVAEYLAAPDVGLAEERRRRIAELVEASRRIDGLASLRNKTIIAHGFRGVSQEELEKSEYGTSRLADDLRESVGSALAVDLSTNPFFELIRLLRF